MLMVSNTPGAHDYAIDFPMEFYHRGVRYIGAIEVRTTDDDRNAIEFANWVTIKVHAFAGARLDDRAVEQAARHRLIPRGAQYAKARAFIQAAIAERERRLRTTWDIRFNAMRATP